MQTFINVYTEWIVDVIEILASYPIYSALLLIPVLALIIQIIKSYLGGN